MKSLHELGVENNTDKGTFHDFLHRYEPFVEPLRNSPVRLLEIGVDGGGSIRMWHDYFKIGNITGIDVNPNCWKPNQDYPRARVITGDVTNESFTKQLTSAEENWNIIWDDGGHHASQQIAAHLAFWPKLTSGGIYVIEDTHVAYDPRYCGGSNQPVILNYILGLVHAMNCHGEGMCGKQDRNKSDIDYVHFSKSFVIIKKL